MQVCCFGKLRKRVQAESHLPENFTSVPASRYSANLRANRIIVPPLLLKIETDFLLDWSAPSSLPVDTEFSALAVAPAMHATAKIAAPNKRVLILD